MAVLIPSAIFFAIAIAYAALLVWLHKPRQPQAFPNPGSAKLAAIEFWVRENFMPEHWPEHKKRTVIELLREGKSATEVARAGAFDIKQIKQIRLALNSNSIAYVSLGQVRHMGNVDPDEEPIKPRDRFKPNVFKNVRGSIAVEFAIIMPVFLLLVLGGADVGYALFELSRLNHAAESAANAGAVGGGGCAIGDTTCAQTYAGNQSNGVRLASFVASLDACGMHVAGTSSSQLINYLIPPIPLSSDACYPIAPGGQKPQKVADLPKCPGGTGGAFSGAIADGTQVIVSDADKPALGQPLSGSGSSYSMAVCNGPQGEWVAE